MTTVRICSVFCVILSLQAIHAVTELLQNPDFESASSWHSNGCTIKVTSDHHTGQHSLQISNRHSNSAGVRQPVHVLPQHRYAAKCFIKLLNTPHGRPYTAISMYQDTIVHGHVRRYTIGTIKMQQVAFGWTEIGGDFVPELGSSSTEVYIAVDKSVNYLIDSCSVQEISTEKDWHEEAVARINSTRKARVVLRLNGSSQSSGYSVELVQTRSAFAWGTAVKATLMTGNNTDYLNFVYDNFEWVVIENALKWRHMEYKHGHETFDFIKALDVLLLHGIKIRGHNMFWGVSRHEPLWLPGLSKAQHLLEMKRHVNSMISHTKGKLQHWDVNNENLHGDYFEQHTGYPNITSEMFQWIHDLDPTIKLFLNDFGVISDTQTTTAMKNQAMQLKQTGVPIYGIGVQGHFHSSNIDMTTLKYRLDKVAEVGLPIWITELTVREKDDNKRATAMENVLTLFFSHPAVEGVLFWGFWDQALFDPLSSLANGPYITINAAGRTYRQLYKKTWRTYVNHSINSSVPMYRRVFLGDYILNVKKDGRNIHQEKFTIDSGGKNLTFHLQDELHVSHIAFG